MSFRRNNQHTISLPIVGNKVIQLLNESMIALLFEDSVGEVASLRIEEIVTIQSSSGETKRIEGTLPGKSFNSEEANILDFFVGKTVKSATAKKGDLEIIFYDESKILIEPTDYGEWHFQKPAPHSKKRYSRKSTFSLSGSNQGFI